MSQSRPPFSISDVMTDLSYMMGESSVPTSGVDDRKVYIQRTLEETHRYANWEWAKVTATIPLASGVATLPTLVALSSPLDVRVKQAGTDLIFTMIPYEEQDSYGAGDYRYWLTGNEGALKLNSNDADATLTVNYQHVPADLLNGESTYFPSSLTLAKGAVRYYRAARDPEYDMSQDDALFKSDLDDIMAMQNRNRPARRIRTIQKVYGTGTGDIG